MKMICNIILTLCVMEIVLMIVRVLVQESSLNRYIIFLLNLVVVAALAIGFLGILQSMEAWEPGELIRGDDQASVSLEDYFNWLTDYQKNIGP